MKSPWYSILNRGAAAPLEIMLYGDIGMGGTEDCAGAELVNLITAAAGRAIRLRINSDGGAVQAGFAIFNALKNHVGGVEVDVEGWAASIASYIAMAGKPIRMASNALMMIHNPSGGARGDARDMQSTAELLAKVEESIITAYAARTGQPRAKIVEMMNAQTWLSAAQAKEMGFCDEITAPLQLAALFDSGKFSPPANLRPPTTMKILNASIIALLATSTGLTLTDASTETEVQNAITALGTRNAQLEADIAAARTSHATLATERDNLTAQFTELTTVANQRQTDLTAAQLSVTNLTAEVTATKALHTTALTNIGRLEALCGVKGIDPNKAVTQIPEASAKSSIADFDARMKAAKTPEERQAITAELTKAHAENRLAA